MKNNVSNKNFRAPMRNESYKRFSIYKKQEKRSWLDFLFDWIIKGIIIALLISINFVLFASSANYSLFAEGVYVIPNIVLPIIVIFTISIGAMFFISFSRILENILVSLVVGFVTYATINQFMTVSPDSFLYSMFYGISPEFARNFINNSDFITAVVFSIVTFVMLSVLSNKFIFYGAVLLLVIFGIVIADEYINQRNKQEFITLYEKEPTKRKAKGNKFIHIMLPNATSYRYLSDLEDDEIAVNDIKKTKELMLGFYAKNNFILYDNAYVEEDNSFMNIVGQFNILSNKKVEDSVLDKILVDGYMKFKNHNEKSVYLEDNKLFDKFKNAKYRINVYQSHGIELCKSNNEVIADKCVEKQNHPFNFEGMDISEIQKTKLLLLQWINSTTLFKDLSGWYSFINVFTDANKVALLGIPYDNLHVINSIKTLDIMFNDILSEDANTTYFALLDIPTEMYVYDDFCNIKPSDQWLSKDNLSWVKVPNLAERRKAYLQQTNCLYGKLQEFMERLKAYDINNNAVVVIQGISGLNNKNDKQNFIESFRSKKSVIMAIREPKKKGFEVDYNLCPVSSILIKYLYGKNVCRPLKNVEMSQSSKTELYKDMMGKPITKHDVVKAKYTFSEWYKTWEDSSSENSSDGVKIIRDMVKFEDPILSKKVERVKKNVPENTIRTENNKKIKKVRKTVERKEVKTNNSQPQQVIPSKTTNTVTKKTPETVKKNVVKDAIIEIDVNKVKANNFTTPQATSPKTTDVKEIKNEVKTDSFTSPQVINSKATDAITKKASETIKEVVVDNTVRTDDISEIKNTNKYIEVEDENFFVDDYTVSNNDVEKKLDDKEINVVVDENEELSLDLNELLN